MNFKIANAAIERKVAVEPDQKGFTLLELLVAMVIFLIVTGSIYGLLQVGRVDRNRSSRRADVLKNARIAIHLIGRDALNAGLGYNRSGAVAPEGFVNRVFGLPSDPDLRRDFITSIMVGNDLLANNLQPNPAVRTDTVIFSYRDMDFNAGDLVSLTDVRNAGTPSIAQVVATAPASPPSSPTGVELAQINDLYLIESPSTQVAIMATAVNGVNTVDAGPGDPLGLNQAFDGIGEAGSVLRKCNPPDPGPPVVEDENCTTYIATTLKHFFIVEYRVNADGTLVRRLYGNNPNGLAPGDQIREQPLAYGVEDMQITYLLEDGTVTNAPTTSSVGPDNDPNGVPDDNIADQVNLIRQVTVTITVQATESDEPVQKPESITFTATFSARNMEYVAG